MLKKIALAAALALPALASAAPYLVMGAASGSADLADVEAGGFTPGAYSSDDGFTRALIGVGFGLNRNLAVEGLYMTEAEASVSEPGREDTLKSSALQFAVIGLAPVAPQFSLFAKLSANYMKVEFESTVFPGDEDTKFQVGFGAGALFQVSDQVGLRLAAERIQVRDAIAGAGDSDIDQASLAVTFSF